jgi:ATP-dependent DNA helicase RecQ
MDQVLFERLRLMRKLLAEKHHVAPYMIFHDATLHQLAATKPLALAAMRGIKGVGESKLAHYGPAFLAVLQGIDPNVVVERV